MHLADDFIQSDLHKVIHHKVNNRCTFISISDLDLD